MALPERAPDVTTDPRDDCKHRVILVSVFFHASLPSSQKKGMSVTRKTDIPDLRRSAWQTACQNVGKKSPPRFPGGLESGSLTVRFFFVRFAHAISGWPRSCFRAKASPAEAGLEN